VCQAPPILNGCLMLSPSDPFLFRCLLSASLRSSLYNSILQSLNLSFRRNDFLLSPTKPFVAASTMTAVAGQPRIQERADRHNRFSLVISCRCGCCWAFFIASRLLRERWYPPGSCAAIVLPFVDITVAIAVVFSWCSSTDYRQWMNALLTGLGFPKVAWLPGSATGGSGC